MLLEGRSYQDAFDFLSSALVPPSHVKRQSLNLIRIEIEEAPVAPPAPQPSAASASKRPLPVKARESSSPGLTPGIEVFDEWAAVIRHQDELSKQKELNERAAQKERQRQYWLALEAQRRETNSRENLRVRKDTLDDQTLLHAELTTGEHTVQADRSQETAKRSRAAAIMAENAADRLRVQELAREAERSENARVLARYHEQQDDEIRKQEETKAAKQQVATALQGSYAAQGELQQRQKRKEREEQLHLSEKWAEVEATTEKQRQRYFDHIREIQKKTEKKEELFKNYVGDRRKELLQQDESRQVRAFAEQEAKEEQKRAQQREDRLRVKRTRYE